MKKDMVRKKHTVGLTKSVGWEMGVRKSLPVSKERAWKLLISPKGIKVWLGNAGRLKVEKGFSFNTKEGISGKFRVVAPGSHLRLSWQPAGWKTGSTLQIRVLAGTDKVAISFHHEKLPSQKERTAMLKRWKEVVEDLALLV